MRLDETTGNLKRAVSAVVHQDLRIHLVGLDEMTKMQELIETQSCSIPALSRRLEDQTYGCVMAASARQRKLELKVDGVAPRVADLPRPTKSWPRAGQEHVGQHGVAVQLRSRTGPWQQSAEPFYTTRGALVAAPVSTTTALYHLIFHASL